MFRKSPPPDFENDKVNPAAEGSRVIAVSFAPQTKTTLEGLQPKFVNEKDTILLYTAPEDENEPLLTDTCVVKVDGSGKATIYTDLTGKLKAIYPAKAAVLEDNVITAEILAVQTGKFADANIAGANIDENNSAQFENVAPLLIITPPSGTKKLIVRSLRTIGEDGQRSEMACPINTSAEEKEQCTITVLNPDNDGRYCVTLYFDYDVKLSDLSFEAWFDEGGTTGSIKGIPEKKIKEQAAATGLKDYEIIQPGTAYTIDDKNWHEYVTIGGRKWATMNVGAEKPEEAGEYFMWGDVAGHKYVSDAWTNFPETNPDGSRYTGTWTPTSGFAGCNAPFVSTYDYNELYWTCSYSKYNETDGKNRLDLCDDAAFANWGGAWRMPTGKESGEFQALYSATYWARESGINGYYAFLPEDAAGHSAGSCGEIGSLDTKKAVLFFPATGVANGMGLLSVGTSDFYFSSSFDKEYSYGLKMIIFNSHIIIDAMFAKSFRCNGHPVRAIIDDGASAPAPGKKEIVLWEDEAVADDWGNQPYLLSDGGLELMNANATEGQEVRFYITAIDDNWKLQIVEGHWGPIYCCYCSVGADTEGGLYTEYDLDANGGYISITLTQAMLDAAFTQQWWGGTFVANGDNIKITKITLY